MFRIIKAPPSKTPPSKTLPSKTLPPGPAAGDSGFVDLSDELHARLETARTEVARLVADARDAADRIRREAHQQGLQLAREAAHQQSREELARCLETALPALDRAVASIEREKAQHLQHCERHVVRLAIAIAERVIRREVSRSPEITLELVREALELAAGSEQITVHLHPSDYETLHDSLSQLTAGRSGTKPWDIVADPQLAPGACLVKTEFGVIDQQFQTQLARIEEELT
jgi:flagellar assembly protein FliH